MTLLKLIKESIKEKINPFKSFETKDSSGDSYLSPSLFSFYMENKRNDFIELRCKFDKKYHKKVLIEQINMYEDILSEITGEIFLSSGNNKDKILEYNEYSKIISNLESELKKIN